MIHIDQLIKEIPYNGLSVKKIFKNEAAETLLISLEKDHHFPEHTSPRDTLLVLLDGSITFKIQNNEYSLNRQDSINFPANEPHSVDATEDSKFLIIR